MPFSVRALPQMLGESGHDPAKYMIAPAIMPTNMIPTKTGPAGLSPPMNIPGQPAKREHTKITAPSFIWAVDLVLTGAVEGVGFVWTWLAPYPADVPQFRQKLSVGSIGFPHLPQNMAASTCFHGLSLGGACCFFAAFSALSLRATSPRDSSLGVISSRA